MGYRVGFPCVQKCASYLFKAFFRLAVSGADYGLHFLTKIASQTEDVFHFGGGLSGHHGKVNDITFCGGTGAESSRYVATVSGK